MKEGSGRRKYDKQFKGEAVRMVNKGGRTVAEVARGLGIHENVLHKWRRQYHEDPVGSFPGKGHLKPGDEEMRRLLKENADLKEEKEILKKALAIFSKHPK